MNDVKYGLRKETICKINNVFARFTRVRSAILYGSRANGTFHNGSDIDLALTGQGLTLQDLLKIKLDLEELNMAYSVDICILEQITNQDLACHIDRVGIAFYERGIIQDRLLKSE